MQDGKNVPALMAGGQLAPEKTGQHLGPYSDKGHLGELPGLVVSEDGTARYTLLAPPLKSVTDLKGRSLMIHKGGDNYSDAPATQGGGGARFACEVIEQLLTDTAAFIRAAASRIHKGTTNSPQNNVSKTEMYIRNSKLIFTSSVMPFSKD